MTRSRNARTTLLLAAAASIALAACSVSTDDATPTPTDPAPVETDAPDTVDTSDAGDTGDTVTTDGDTTETTVPEESPMIPVRGVTDDTIKLGIAPIDVDLVRERFGVDLGNVPEGAVEALVAEVNANGGINGRQVEIVSRPFMPVGTEDAEATCRELIEDHEVYAVIGFFLGDGALCVTETYATPYFSQFGLNAERQERSIAPFISLEGDALAASIDKAIAEGVFDGKQLAIYHESDVQPALVQADIVPPLEAAGIEVVSTAQLPSSGDAVQAAADIDVIFQRFQADGADALLAVSGAATLLPALERTDWAPQLVFTNGQFTGDGGLANFGLTDFGELEGALAVTMSLLSDDLAGDELMLDCIATINGHSGGDITIDDIYDPAQKPGSRQYGTLPALCQVWTMTVAVLEAVGNDLTPEPMRAALDRVGTFALPGYEHAEVTSERWGAVDSVRVWNFDAATERFVPHAG